MSKLIGLCGYAEVGKDEAFKQYKFINKDAERFAFADELKIEVSNMLESIGIYVDFTIASEKKKWRDMLVFWGQKQRQRDPMYWINAVDGYIQDSISSINLITDVRFTNEVEYILSQGGAVYNIWRPKHLPANAEEVKSFEKIARLYPDLPIIKNNGTKKELGKNLYKLIGEL